MNGVLEIHRLLTQKLLNAKAKGNDLELITEVKSAPFQMPIPIVC